MFRNERAIRFVVMVTPEDLKGMQLGFHIATFCITCIPFSDSQRRVHKNGGPLRACSGRNKQQQLCKRGVDFGYCQAHAGKRRLSLVESSPFLPGTFFSVIFTFGFDSP